MSEALTLAAWRARLERAGQPVKDPERETLTGFRLWPGPEVVITVGVEPDGTLYPQYRQRFFVCELEPEWIFRVIGCPEPLRLRWLELVSRQPAGYWQDFLVGPGAWLLSRLSRFDEVVAWADYGLAWDALDCPTHRGWRMEVPAEAAPFFPPTQGPGACNPCVIPVDGSHFPDAVAACLLFASVGLHDCYLADATGAQVYLAHHHDEIFVSIPEAGEREALLTELRAASWVFNDVSGYASTMDDEDDAGTSEDW
jgi:hypothetical protein